MLHDLRLALRALRREPAFTAAAVITLALGIGANSAIFSVVHAVLLAPLPFPQGDQLVRLQPQQDGDPQAVSYPDFRDWQAAAGSFTAMGAFNASTVTLSGAGEPEIVEGAFVTSGLLDVLGVPPVLGRTLRAGEDQPGAAPVVVLGHRLWQRRFGGDPGVLGAAVILDGTPFTVVGVMPEGFRFPIAERPQEVWLPLAASGFLARNMDGRGAALLAAVGRLARGVDPAAAEAEMAGIAARLEAAYPETNEGVSVRLLPFREQLVSGFRKPLLLLLGAVGFVLLIACANVANLLLVRAVARRREMAIRASLGAGRWRLARQLLTESVALAAVGGALGLLLAGWGVDGLLALLPMELPRLAAVAVNGPVLAFTAALAMATGVAFGMAPALGATGADPGTTLAAASGRSTGDRRSQRLRRSLVAAEVALALVLLIGAGLLVRSLRQLQEVDPGFATEGLVTASVSLPSERYPHARRAQFAERLVARVAALPGVESAAVVLPLPLSADRIGLSFSIEGRPTEAADRPTAQYFTATPGYLEALGIRLVRGRGIEARDRDGAPAVIVVNEALVGRYFPGQEPIGQQLVIGVGEPQPREIVGVVADVRRDGPQTAPEPQFYTPFAQTPWPFFSIVVRAAGAPEAAVRGLREVLAELDPDQALEGIATMEERARRAVAQPRFQAVLVGAFSALALALAMVGIYGVMSFAARQRAREIGVRMAFGARPGDVVRLLVAQGARIALAGLAAGLAVALAVGRWLASLLFEVSATDALTFAAASAALLVTVLLASWLPARRAARQPPAAVLRAD